MSVDQVPFRLNAGDLNLTASVAFAPYAEIGFTVCTWTGTPVYYHTLTGIR